MQVPPPPQAEGRKIFLSPRVDRRELPEATSSFFSPLMVMVTGPEGESFSLVNNKRVTSSNKRIIKATTVIRMVPRVLVASIMLILLWLG
jgi:hypothetical protein